MFDALNFVTKIMKMSENKKFFRGKLTMGKIENYLQKAKAQLTSYNI